MGKILKVTIEYTDQTCFVEGKEAEKWLKHCDAITINSNIHGLNPFESDPIKWVKVFNSENEQGVSNAGK